MTQVIDRITSLMELRGVKARSLKPTLARVCGISYQAVSQWFDGSTSNIKNEHLLSIAEEYDATVDWLLSGKGQPPSEGGWTKAENATGTASAAAQVQKMLAKHGKGLTDEARQKIAMAVEESLAEQAAASAAESNVIVADFSRRPTVGDEIRIAHYDVQGAMGNGKQVHDFPEMFRDVTVSQQHLRELGVKYQDPAHLKLITGDGESMSPTIQDKDPMIVDASVREFTSDGIYGFTWQGLFYIKRLQVADTDHFEMISDNQHHKDRLIRVDETYIQCKVLLVWNSKRV